MLLEATCKKALLLIIAIASLAPCGSGTTAFESRRPRKQEQGKPAALHKIQPTKIESVRRCSSLPSLEASKPLPQSAKSHEEAIVSSSGQRDRTQSAPIEIPYTHEQKMELKKNNYMRSAFSSYDEESEQDSGLSESSNESSSSYDTRIPEMFAMSLAGSSVKSGDSGNSKRTKRSKKVKASANRIRGPRTVESGSESEDGLSRPSSFNSKRHLRARTGSSQSAESMDEIIHYDSDDSFNDADEKIRARNWRRVEQAYERKASSGSFDSDFGSETKAADAECIFNGSSWDNFSI